jgi:flagellar motor component MotA
VGPVGAVIGLKYSLKQLEEFSNIAENMPQA